MESATDDEVACLATSRAMGALENAFFSRLEIQRLIFAKNCESCLRTHKLSLHQIELLASQQAFFQHVCQLAQLVDW